MRQLSAALTLSIIGVVSIAEAQTGWTGDVRTIFTTVFPTPFSLAATAVDPNGNAYAIWTVGDSATSSTSRIEVARYVAATDSWGVPITLAGPGQFGLPRVAVDTSGNAFFLVPQVLGGRAQIEVIRHESVTATNTTFVAQNAFGGEVKVDAAGNAMVVWSADAGMFAARYNVALATWGAPAKISNGNALFLVPQVLGGRAQIEVIRHESVSATNTTTLVAQNAFGGEVKVDAAGNAMVVWSEDAGIFAARYDVALATWGAPVRISDAGAFSELAVDGLSDITAIWMRELPGPSLVVQAARFDSSTGVWSPVVDPQPPFQVRTPKTPRCIRHALRPTPPGT